MNGTERWCTLCGAQDGSLRAQNPCRGQPGTGGRHSFATPEAPEEGGEPEDLPGGWCPQCGPLLDEHLDEDGCCATCGATAVGPGASQALALQREKGAADRWFREFQRVRNKLTLAEAARTPGEDAPGEVDVMHGWVIGIGFDDDSETEKEVEFSTREPQRPEIWEKATLIRGKHAARTPTVSRRDIERAVKYGMDHFDWFSTTEELAAMLEHAGLTITDHPEEDDG